MKHVLAGLVLSLLAVVGAAAQDFDAERKRIRQQRAQAQERLEAEEKACYRRFAVTDCLDAARKQGNAAIADLRRQEVLLNDTERKRRAAERLQEGDARKAAEPARENPAAVAETRREAQAQKSVPQSSPRAARAFEGPKVDTAQAARNQQTFEARRRQAEAHKAEVLERNAKRAKPPSADLPPP